MVRAMRSDRLDRCLHMKNELCATSQNDSPWGRVSRCLQCNISTPSYACCGHSPGKKPPSSYLRRARTGGRGALRCRVAALVSHFPRVKSCRVALFTRRSAYSSGESSCVFAAIASGQGASRRGGPRLRGSNGGDEEAAEATRRSRRATMPPPRLTFGSGGQGGVESAHLVFTLPNSCDTVCQPAFPVKRSLKQRIYLPMAVWLKKDRRVTAHQCVGLKQSFGLWGTCSSRISMMAFFKSHFIVLFSTLFFNVMIMHLHRLWSLWIIS